jgi:eukaryotic-like serine/threonine-protein kinase
MSSESGPPRREAAPLGERPAADELALTVAQARIATRLFGVEKTVAVGRYRLLELVGRGGRGVVWGAWDPELERKVAIKLVDQLHTAARDRIVDEARALAKLSHPNVVPVYDVGVVDDRVYLVMEWVAGENLRAHLAGRQSIRAIVDVYAQAARGLAAVHTANLVHRDFKPENAMVGGDGRVRVLDFGLARADVAYAADARHAVGGTPHYMAPEQRAGAPPTAAVDQYALCVALRDALEARDGDGKTALIPRWLQAIITRGTAPGPDARFGTIDEVIRALGQDPRRVWQRRVIVGVALVAAVAAFAIGRSVEAEACAGTLTASSAGVTPEVRARLVAHLEQLGGFAAGELPGLVRTLDTHEHDRRIAHRAACLAHERRELTTTLYERRLTCFARAEASLAASAEILTLATRETFPDARVAAAALVDPVGCAQVDQSLIAPPAPAVDLAVRAVAGEIERARIFVTAQRPDAVAVATTAREHAEATGYAPVIGHALLVQGRAEMALADDRASATLDRAMRTAVSAHDDVTAVEAFARRAYVVAIHDAKPIDGASWIGAVADRLGAQGRFARLLLYNNLAVVQLAMSDRPGARTLFEIAIRDWRPGQGEDDFELAAIPQNLALVVEQPAESVALLRRAQAEIARTVGADHPMALDARMAEVLFVGDLASARALRDDACARLRRLFPHLRAELAEWELEAAWLADEAGDLTAAVEHLAAAVAIDPDTERARVKVAATFRELLGGEGRPDEMANRLEAIAKTAAMVDEVWLRIDGADAYIAAARAWELAGARDAALRCWAAALAIIEPLDQPFIARRLARTRTALARGLATHDRARSELHAHGALAWYRSVGGNESVVLELAKLANQ